MNRRRRVRVPASSANLGPGFDSMAAALSLHLELDVEETGTFGVETDLPVPRDRSNVLVEAWERLAPADGFTFRVTSRIPLAGGLGSSAAARVAGLLAADHLFELDADVLALATTLEDHPDNAAAALCGGFVVCAEGRVARVDTPAGLEAVLLVPHAGVGTAEARAALPATVPLADAAFNAAHAALLAVGLATGDWELVGRGLRDRLHQPHRARLFPRSAALLARAQELGALGATLSGAGPSVLFWSHYEMTRGLMERLAPEAEGWAELRRIPFEPQGADVVRV